MATKALPGDRNDLLRKMLQEIVDRDFDGNRASAARRLRISQSYVQEFLQGARGAGQKLLEGLADYTNRSVDELMGRRGPTAAADELRQLRDARGWDEAAAAVREERPEFSAAILERVGSMVVKLPPPIDQAHLVVNPRLVASLAELALKLEQDIAAASKSEDDLPADPVLDAASMARQLAQAIQQRDPFAHELSLQLAEYVLRHQSIFGPDLAQHAERTRDVTRHARLAAGRKLAVAVLRASNREHG